MANCTSRARAHLVLQTGVSLALVALALLNELVEHPPIMVPPWKRHPPVVVSLVAGGLSGYLRGRRA